MQTTEETAELAVYEMGPDKYVARSASHAWELFEEHTGEKREDHAEDPPAACAADKMIGILVDESGSPSDSGEALHLTAAEWCAREGEGFLCSSEY